MSDSAILGLPFVQPAQAQKHVPVNEAFARLDALTQLTVKSVGATVPPIGAEGDVHAVGVGAGGGWSGQDGALAVFVNGGWSFVTPRLGWRAFRSDLGEVAVFNGSDWSAGAGSVSPSGAGFVHRSVEQDHTLGSGATSVVAGALPANAIVYGITGRVLSAIGGASSFQIGVSGSADLYGSGIGVGAGSWARGITGNPLTYYSDTDIVLTADGGNFNATGTFRLAVHFAELTLPSA